MWKTVVIYGAALAAASFALEWMEYEYLVRSHAPEFYVVAIAAGFTALGLWAGRRLTEKIPPRPFVKNADALRALGVTAREYEVLALLAEGCANKEIARRLEVSPNTVKTHLGRLYAKLEVERRTRAIAKAKELALIP